jgi:hypothetical protein
MQTEVSRLFYRAQTALLKDQDGAHLERGGTGFFQAYEFHCLNEALIKAGLWYT